MSVNSTDVYDICGSRISSPEGYLLVTSQVVSEPKYWQHYYRQHADEFALLGVASFEAFKHSQALREHCTRVLAGQSTPWMVCASCIGMFSVDHSALRRDAAEWWRTGGAFKPEGNGPAPLSAVMMEAVTPTPATGPVKRPGLFESLIRSRRIKRIWAQATHLGTSSEATRELCTELLDLLDERSIQPDIGRVYLVRGNTYIFVKNYDQALQDYTEAAEFFLRTKNLFGINDCERRLRFMHETRLYEQVKTDSEKAGKLQGIHFTSAFIKMEWDYLSASRVEKLLSFLGDTDPDVRAYAAFSLSDAPIIKPEAKKWLVETYCNSLTQEEDRSARIGRRVGEMLCMGPGEVIPADLVWMKLGTNLPRSFVNCNCAFCSYLNRGIPVPPRGLAVPFYSQRDRQGVYVVPVLCVRCCREFFLTWDSDPRN